MKSMKFDPSLVEKVNMDKVNLDIIKPWIQKRVTELLGGIEDEVLIGYIFELLETDKNPDPKQLQIAVTGFLNGKNARILMGELWNHLLSAQKNIGGIPNDFLEQKKAEIRQRKQETERIQAGLRKTQSVEADSTSKEIIEKAKSLAKNAAIKRRRSVSPMAIPTTTDLHTPTMKDQISIRKTLVGYMSSPATTPVIRTKPGWYAEHEKHVEMAKTSSANVLLIGDSIIQGLARYPKVWNQYFTPLKALNFGLGGDRTQNVLWRVENGEIPLNAQTIVIHVGTNNTDGDDPKEIANGIGSIATIFQEAKPNAKIVLTGLLPRDLQPSHRRHQTQKVNKYLKKLCKSGHVRNFYYLKPDPDWVLPDGTLNTQYYFVDHLHLVEQGDEKFAKAIAKTIQSIYGGSKIEYSSDSDISGDEVNSSFHIEPIKSQRRSYSVSPVRTLNNKDRSVSPRKRSRSISPRRTHSRRRSRSPRRYSRSPRRRRERSRRNRSRSRTFSRSPKRRRRRSPTFSRSPSPKVVNSNLRELTKIPSPSPPPSHSNDTEKLQPKEREDSEELVKIKPADEGLMKDDYRGSPTSYNKSEKTSHRTYRQKQSESDESEDEEKLKTEVMKSPSLAQRNQRSRRRQSPPYRRSPMRRRSPERRTASRKARSPTFTPSPPRRRRSPVRRKPQRRDTSSSSRSPSPKRPQSTRKRRASTDKDRSTSPELRKRREMRRKREAEAIEQRQHKRELERQRDQKARDKERKREEAEEREQRMAIRLREKHRQRQRHRRSPSQSDSAENSDHEKERKNRKRMLAEAARRVEQSSSEEEKEQHRRQARAKHEEKKRYKKDLSGDESEKDRGRQAQKRRKHNLDEVKVFNRGHKRELSEEPSEDDRKEIHRQKQKGSRSKAEVVERRGKKYEESSEEEESNHKKYRRKRKDTEESHSRHKRDESGRNRRHKEEQKESEEEEEASEEEGDRRRVILTSRKQSESPKKTSRQKSKSPSLDLDRSFEKEFESEDDSEQIADVKVRGGSDEGESLVERKDVEQEKEEESSPERDRRRRKSSRKEKKNKRRKSKKKKSRKRRNYSSSDDDYSDRSEEEEDNGSDDEKESKINEDVLRERALKSMKMKHPSSSESE